MNSHFKIFAVGILFSGCLFDQERVAGGEDFPNTVTVLGKVASDGIASQSSWDQFQEIPVLPDLKAGDSLDLIPPASPAALPKGSGSFADSILWDSSTIALGYFRKIVIQDSVLKLKFRHDTLTYRADGDTVPGNEILLGATGFALTTLPYKMKVYRIVNLDSAGAPDQADYGEIVRALDSTQRFQHLRVFGMNGVYASAADRRVMEYSFLRLRGSDTLDWIQALDADKDGTLWGAGDSGVIELRYQGHLPSAKLHVERMSLSLRAKIYGKGASSVPLLYHDSRLLKNGIATVFHVQGTGADSLMRLGDSALVTFDQIFPADASIVESHGRFRVLLGAIAWRFYDNQMLGFELDRSWRAGPIRHAVLTYAPDAPIRPGQLDPAGNFLLSLGYEDGATGEVNGSFRGGNLNADLLELRQGLRKAFRLVYDARGNLLRGDSLAIVP